MAIATLTINSCTKQEDEQQAVMQKEKPAATAEEKAIINNILSFKEKIEYINENPGFKSGEQVEVDSAVWYLDATLNLSHAFISWTPMSNFYQDSVFVTIPKTGDEVDMNDLAAAYTELKQKVATVCIAAPGNDKELYIATLVKKEDTGGELTIKTNVTIGTKGVAPGSENPFTYGWYYGDKLGDEYGHLEDTADACTELRDATNYYRSLYIDDDTMLYILPVGEDPYVIINATDPYFINPDDPIPNDNYYDRLLEYQKTDTIYHQIIYEDEMNFYYHSLHNIVYNMIPEDQVKWPDMYGKTFIQVVNDDLKTFGKFDNNEHLIFHQFEIEYRKAIKNGIKGTEPTSIVE